MKTQVTYLDHSGFVVERDNVTLVFDYYRDPTDSLSKILRSRPEVPVVFFVSHHHADHFNKSIFDMAQNHERVYVLSDDIKGCEIGDELPIAWIHADVVIDSLPGDISVKAFGSTDVGVSYLVTFSDGRTCFHAGDFNYWHWENESTEHEVRRAYEAFVHVMQRITEYVKDIDIVFFPVDPRLGENYALGARLFMENINVSNFFPMHFWDNGKAAICFEDYATDNTECHGLITPGANTVI